MPIPLLAVEMDAYTFACDGPLFGVRHGLNVLTNLPFLFIGIWGIVAVLRKRCAAGLPCGDALGLWISTALLCFGSGAYHYFLNAEGLAVDRACIAGIMAFFAADSLVLTLGWKPDLRRSFVFLAVAEASVIVWYLGASPLFYGALQALGAVAVLALFVRAWRRRRLGWKYQRPAILFLGLYGVAKVFEAFDEPICRFTGVFGGHPVKHLLAAAGLAAVVSLTARTKDPRRVLTPSS